MTDDPVVVAVCGSRRDGSHTRTALRHALDAAAAAGARTELLDLGAVDLPLYDPDADAQGESAALVERVREADGVLLGSPVYHGSYSSTLKNFHDYCSYDEYEDTAVGLLAVAGGGSAGGALEHMRATVRSVHGHCVPEQVAVEAAYDQFDDGEFVDPDLAERVAELATAVVERARLYRESEESGAAAEAPAATDD